MLVILFEMTLKNSMESGNNVFPIAVFFLALALHMIDNNFFVYGSIFIGFFVYNTLLDLIMDDQITEMIGWLGFALVSMGYYFNAKKKLYCFYIWGLGNAVYVLYGFIIKCFSNHSYECVCIGHEYLRLP